jgi:hypothetical protein
MARGSIRQRGRGRRELRVYAGVDAATGAAALRDAHGARFASGCGDVRWTTWRRRSITRGRMPGRLPTCWSAGSLLRRRDGRLRRWRSPAPSSTVTWRRIWVTWRWRSRPRPTSMTSTVSCCAVVAARGRGWRQHGAPGPQRAASGAGAGDAVGLDLAQPGGCGHRRSPAGLPHFRLHDLRHFMATEMLSAGVPLATVSQRLNHARISTTVNVYTHAIPAWDRPAAEKLAAILAGDNNTPEHARRS